MQTSVSSQKLYIIDFQQVTFLFFIKMAYLLKGEILLQLVEYYLVNQESDYKIFKKTEINSEF
jgi:hypothetical protein